LYTGGLRDFPVRLNRPLRRGKALQSTEAFMDGIGWCVFFEVGSQPQTIPVGEKLKEFMNIFNTYGEKTPE
jgi:hypothetical protein